MAPTARASRSKKAKVVEEVDREQNDIAPLTGNLVKLVSWLDPNTYRKDKIVRADRIEPIPSLTKL